MTMRPELIPAIQIIYRDMAHLQPGEDVLIIADSQTPHTTVSTLQGEALAMGARPLALLVPTPPPVVLQPSIEWPRALVAAVRSVDFIVDLVVGYASFMTEAVCDGARALCLGIGPGNEQLADTFFRTIVQADLAQIRRDVAIVADIITRADEARITSDEGTDLIVDLRGSKCEANDGFLWDEEAGEFRMRYEFLPPASPAVDQLQGDADGILAVDGFVQHGWWSRNEVPRTPVLLRIEGGMVTDIGGDSVAAARLRRWLETYPSDPSVRQGPVCFSIGVNPLAMDSSLTDHMEYERASGVMSFCFGDATQIGALFGIEGHRFGPSPVHWDVSLMRPTVELDGKLLVDHGVVQPLHQAGAQE